jgi:hypothetical protein
LARPVIVSLLAAAESPSCFRRAGVNLAAWLLAVTDWQMECISSGLSSVSERLFYIQKKDDLSWKYGLKMGLM